MENIDGFFIGIFAGVFLLVGIAIGFMCKPMEIQNVKPVDNGYYITINDEIYYSEVSND